MTIRESIRAYVLGAFHAPRDLSDDASLVEGGFLGSDELTQVITFVEESYLVDVSDADVCPENFDSIAKMAAYVDRKLAALETRRGGCVWPEERAGA